MIQIILINEININQMLLLFLQNFYMPEFQKFNLYSFMYL